MISNPFTSDTFTGIWEKHFLGEKPSQSPEFIKHLRFFNSGFLDIYHNVGATNTKGITYALSAEASPSKKSQVYLIFDVHPLYQESSTPSYKGLKCIKVEQYPGYAVQLSQYQSFDEYLSIVYNSKSRNTLLRKKRKLEENFPVRYTTYFGTMDRASYLHIFSAFREMLEKRFDDKKEENNNLDPGEWAFFEEVTYPMILEKKACLAVCSDGDKPIGIMLNYLSKDVLFQSITGFDIDYYKFNVGTVNILNLISWCIDNKIQYLDFSKGYYEYKTHWGTSPYSYEYHIWYHNNNFASTTKALLLANYFRLKQFLRKQNIPEKKRKLVYFLRQLKAGNR